jgi:hypothetical protein
MHEITDVARVKVHVCMHEITDVSRVKVHVCFSTAECLTYLKTTNDGRWVNNCVENENENFLILSLENHLFKILERNHKVYVKL